MKFENPESDYETMMSLEEKGRMLSAEQGLLRNMPGKKIARVMLLISMFSSGARIAEASEDWAQTDNFSYQETEAKTYLASNVPESGPYEKSVEDEFTGKKSSDEQIDYTVVPEEAPKSIPEKIFDVDGVLSSSTDQSDHYNRFTAEKARQATKAAGEKLYGEKIAEKRKILSDKMLEIIKQEGVNIKTSGMFLGGFVADVTASEMGNRISTLVYNQVIKDAREQGLVHTSDEIAQLSKNIGDGIAHYSFGSDRNDEHAKREWTMTLGADIDGTLSTVLNVGSVNADKNWSVKVGTNTKGEMSAVFQSTF